MYQTRTQLIAYALAVVALILLIGGVEGEPTVSIDSGPNDPSNSEDAEFTVSSSGADEVVCDLDDAVVECDEEIVGIAEGEHTFTATAIEREIGLEWHQDFGNSQFHAVAISADGEYMVAGGWENNNRVYLFETGSSTPLWEYETGNQIHDVAISADGEYIVVASKDNNIYLFDKDSSTPLWSYDTGMPVYLVDISADGEYIAAGQADLFFFNRDSSTPIWIAEQGSYDGGEGHSMKTLDLSADGEYIAVGTVNSGYITLFDTDDNTPLWEYDTIPGEPFKDIKSIAISDDGEYIVAGSEDHNVYFFDKDSNNPLWTYDATDDADTSQGDIDTVDISADGEYIVASSKCYNACSTLIYLFERDSSTPVWTYNVGSASGDHILSIAISDNGEYIVAGSRNNHNVYFFDKDSNIPLFNHENDNDVWEVAISADGGYFATVGFSGEVRLFSKVDNTATDSFTWYIDLTAGGKLDSGTAFVARNGKFVEGVMNYHGGSYEDPEYQMTNNDFPQITIRFTSDSSDSLAPRVSPQGFGYMDIFYTNHDSDDNYDEHKWDSCYWNDDDNQCGPTQSRPSNWDNNQNFVQRIYFNISRDTYSWNADGDGVSTGVGEDYTIDLVADDLRQNQDSDFSIKIYFTNTFADDFCSELSNTNCDSELDNNEYDGRSYWDWFLLERD